MGSQRIGHDLATEQQQQHLWRPPRFTKGETQEQTWESKGESQWGPMVVVDISLSCPEQPHSASTDSFWL